jgi:hypothetical protein
MPTNRKTRRDSPRRCQGCQRFGTATNIVTFDPGTRWWLCFSCMERIRTSRHKK